MNKPGGTKSGITDEDKKRLFYPHYSMTRTYLVILEIHRESEITCKLCLTNELGIPISFKHLQQRITKDLGVMQKAKIGTATRRKGL